MAGPLKQPSKRRKVTGSAAALHAQNNKPSRPVRRQARAQSPEVAALKPPAKVPSTTRSGRRTTRISYAEAGAEEEQVGNGMRKQPRQQHLRASAQHLSGLCQHCLLLVCLHVLLPGSCQVCWSLLKDCFGVRTTSQGTIMQPAKN